VLAHFSRYVVFQPGDLIAMGAPSGVAVGQPNAAELYLRPGDNMVIAFEGIMSLRTRIVAERSPRGRFSEVCRAPRSTARHSHPRMRAIN
jgi:hypothetical protein